jgi:diaminohydroxyphosphoribosylaminopyrimidine deaminase/5-amino-6-(5-phosphoribosylamino)uracil reductase
MRKALRLARRGEGGTRPNPPVGAVVVRRGRVVGHGFHRRAGEPHAEALAIRSAGPACRGATLYVTLEPCCTTGRTGPCTEVILRSGIRRVVAAVRDPNPRHCGRGLALLRRRGIEVVEGVCAAEAARLLAPFRKWITTGRPYLTLKMGTTLDGRIADARGRSRWITCPASRSAVGDLRRRVDAVMVGGDTVRADDPSLLPPADGSREGPLRVVVDSRGRVPAGARVLTDGRADRTVVATTSRAGLAAEGTSLAWVLRRLGSEGVLHVLCEGGGRIARSLVRAGLVDEFLFFVAPRLLGGDGVAAVAGPGWALQKGPRLRFVEVRRVGADVMVRAVPSAE